MFEILKSAFLRKFYHAIMMLLHFVENHYIYKIKQTINCDPHNVNFGGLPDEFNGGQYMTIADGTFISKHVFLNVTDHYSYLLNGDMVEQSLEPQLEIGKNCIIGMYNHITCTNHIKIGDNLLTGRWVTITDNSHGKSNIEDLKIPPVLRKIYSKGDIVIGDNVWIGDHATILPGVKIGDGVNIGANSVVTKDIPSYCVACGNPIKIIQI